MPKLPSKPIRSEKLGQKVADHLRREILEGRLKPGDNLPSELELMELFNVSRPTLREAMRILESLGLITVYRGKKGGAEVKLPSMDVTAVNAAIYLQSQQANFLELQQTRTIIEASLIPLLKGQIKKKDIAALRGFLDQAEKSVDSASDYAEAITLYHEYLVGILDNKVLNLMIGVLHNVYKRHVAGIIAATPDEVRQERLPMAVKNYRHLIDLIEAGNFEEADAFNRKTHGNLDKWHQKRGSDQTPIDSFDWD